VWEAVPSSCEVVGLYAFRAVLPALKHEARARILPHSRPRRSMIGAYGDTGCSPRSEAQTRKPQLGASHCAVARSAYWI
jgi:hypothetical protein